MRMERAFWFAVLTGIVSMSLALAFAWRDAIPFLG